MANWHTIESARDEWPDAPVDYEDGGDDTLAGLLAVAKDAVVAFAPVSNLIVPDPYSATSVEPDVATMSLAPVGGFVSATVSVPNGDAFSDEVLFALPASYVPDDYVTFASQDGRITAYTPDAGIATLRVSVAPGAGPASLAMAWVPSIPFGNIPEGYRKAQLLQARNVWNSSKASPQGDFDSGSYGLSSFPLDWQVRQLIRPKRGRPVLG